MAKKFWYILLDWCDFFQILESGDSFFLNYILKTKSSKNLKKLGMCFSTGSFI